MAKTTWRYIHSGALSGASNMALDEALLDAVARGSSPPVLRFYRWLPATVTLGYAQSVRTDVDLDVCRGAGLDVVRRSTGGRAVLHDREVTYAVIAPLDDEMFGQTVLDCYRGVAEILRETLVRLGLPAQLVPGRPKGGPQSPARAVCFSAPSQYELVIDGCKVAGSAQRRQGRAFLQHGSLPLEMDLDLLGRALRLPRGEDLSSTVGWLNRWAASPLAVERVETTLAEVFFSRMAADVIDSRPTEEEQVAVDTLRRERFGNPDWTFSR